MKSENLFDMSLIPLIFSISRPSRLHRANLHGNPPRTGKPPGKPVDENHVFVFLLIVALDGFYSDIIRTDSFHGTLMLGLAILDGLPLGTAVGITWRDAQLEPADEAGHRTYIVLLEPPAGGQDMTAYKQFPIMIEKEEEEEEKVNEEEEERKMSLPQCSASGSALEDMDADAHRAWLQSFLPSMTTTLDEPRLRRSYRTLVNGFSARLMEEDVERVSAKTGSTWTPAFLGLSYHMGHRAAAAMEGLLRQGHQMQQEAHQGLELRWLRTTFGCRGRARHPCDDHRAGNFIAGTNVNGLASGNASGMAPQAHVAVYKACGERGCPNESLMSAILVPVDDGADVISLSIGGTSEPTYDHDPIVVASLAAMRAGVLVVANAGNNGQ
ncbi:hypothetical protein C2845_PM06G18750 [Panicum miliaceum]|uniref:Uncharacterized protein n=1 Tax=Panicum miliaceum TaxID=4540 RepID=A0A3L6R658_PANMI|nr:hypothetical protein C2845_PM06G18750 [Panicum miliaceum]